jgi:cardiolipin synthase A/B
VTRRAPPLAINSCHLTTQHTAHRPRWAVLFGLLVLCATFGGCKVLPEVQFARSLPLSRSRAPVDLESADGMVGRAASIRLTRKLSVTGATSLLDYHLAAMRDIGAPPLLTGNGVDLLIDGPRTYEAMFTAIEQAREYVLVESFIFEEAIHADRRLSSLLTQAAKRGVHIYVLYDAVGSLTTDEKFLSALGSAGVSMCAFNPLNPFDHRFAGLNQRDHRKIVVIDGAIAFAGGVNFSNAYRIASRQARRRGLSQQNALHEGWRDTHIGLRGNAAKHLESLFRETWTKAECDGAVVPAFVPDAVKGGDKIVQIVASTPDDATNEIYATLLSVLMYAQKSVDITMAYFVPDDTLENALKAAAQRGVQVRIILPSYSDFSGVFYAGRAHYRELLDSGVKLYELEDAFLHSKSIVVDGVWSSIGSTNFDWRSFVHNNEISVCVIDEGFARQMNEAFARDLADSDEITLAEWKKRGLKERLKELLWLPIQYWL